MLPPRIPPPARKGSNAIPPRIAQITPWWNGLRAHKSGEPGTEEEQRAGVNEKEQSASGFKIEKETKIKRRPQQRRTASFAAGLANSSAKPVVSRMSLAPGFASNLAGFTGDPCTGAIANKKIRSEIPATLS